MQNKRETDIAFNPKVVFMNTYGGPIGGVTLSTAEFAEDDIIPAATIFGKDAGTGLAKVLKSARLQADAANNAVIYRVEKLLNPFKVGDVIALNTGGKASTITAIDKTNAAYDAITVDLTLGVVAVAGAGIMEAAATSTTTTSAPKVVPYGVTAVPKQIEKGGNNLVGAWTRCDIFAKRAPAYPDTVKALLPQIQWFNDPA